MAKFSWCFIIGLWCVSACLAQDHWTVPKLRELSYEETIKTKATLLSADETELLKQVTEQKIDECVQDPGPGDPTTADDLFSQLRVQRVRLTHSGKTGVVAQGSAICMCGAVGNCPLWIIIDAPRPTMALATYGVQSFAFQNSKTTDHFDLVLGSHDSASVTDLQEYQFDGVQYRLNRCASLHWGRRSSPGVATPTNLATTLPLKASLNLSIVPESPPTRQLPLR